jgi:hypothetical protein
MKGLKYTTFGTHQSGRRVGLEIWNLVHVVIGWVELGQQGKNVSIKWEKVQMWNGGKRGEV